MSVYSRLIFCFFILRYFVPWILVAALFSGLLSEEVGGILCSTDRGIRTSAFWTRFSAVEVESPEDMQEGLPYLFAEELYYGWRRLGGTYAGIRASPTRDALILLSILRVCSRSITRFLPWCARNIGSIHKGVALHIFIDFCEVGGLRGGPLFTRTSWLLAGREEHCGRAALSPRVALRPMPKFSDTP